MAIFGPKPWVNNFQKNVNFSTFSSSFFYCLKGDFPFKIIVKDIFLAFIAKKKKLEKWPFLDQNHGLTPLEICQFFDFLNFFFYSLERPLFVLEYRKRHFPGPYCLKKKLERWPFLDQNHGLTPFKKCQCFEFLNFLFLQPRKAFFRFRIS